VRHLNCFRELSAAALLTLGLSVNVSAQTNTLPEIPEIPAAAATNYLNQEVVVTDNVAQVALRPTVALINLNQRYPDSPLTCVIRGDDTNNFPNVESYVGAFIEVTGRIVDYQGRPEIVLTSTNQIKVLTAATTIVKPAPQAPEPQTKAAPPTVQTDENPNRLMLWIVGSLGFTIALLGVLAVLFWRRNLSNGRMTQSAMTLLRLQDDRTIDPSSLQEWKQRALVAEAMAGKQGQMLREKIMPELTEFAKQSLVQGLYAQRNALIETQQKAQQALAELEARLTALQLPLHERIRAYEKRIAELEKEVETQGEEVRELTRATLALVRKKLEDEREHERTQNRFN